MPMSLTKLSDETGRIAAFHRLDPLAYSSEASFNHITRLLQLSLGMEHVTISLINEDKQIFKARQGIDMARSPRATAFCNITICKYEPLVIEDTHQDARVRDNPFVTEDPFLRCYIGAPLTTADGYNIGTICAFESEPRQFTVRETELISKYAELVMNQLELRSLACVDFLTDVLNRRSFVSGLERELARVRRNEMTSTVAFLDIDHFKKVNDRFGHPVGDRVLQEFASAVSGQCRQNDLVARLGGEEFAVLLTDSDLDAALVWADRLRTLVAENRFGGNVAVSITVSVGLVALDEKLTTYEAVMSMADRALYAAKRQGRNRVVA